MANRKRHCALNEGHPNAASNSQMDHIASASGTAHFGDVLGLVAGADAVWALRFICVRGSLESHGGLVCGFAGAVVGGGLDWAGCYGKGDAGSCFLVVISLIFNDIRYECEKSIFVPMAGK
jgi:hypothetical protein